jgi:hypothetical protein
VKKTQEFKDMGIARHWWLTPVILATQEAEIRRITVQCQPGQIVHRPYFETPFTKIGLVEWIKMKALRSSPGIIKKKKKERKKECGNKVKILRVQK